MKSLPEDPAAVLSPEEARECFKKFNASFEQAHRKQSECVIPDSNLRKNIKVSVARKILAVYREFHNKNRVIMGTGRIFGFVVIFTPEDVQRHLSDLFFS